MTGATVRAVIVDDEPAGRDAVRTFLADVATVEVVGEAANGRAAIELVRAQSPDLLFLDVQMPDVDGFGVIEALGDDVPPGIVLVTAHSEHAQRAFDVHALDYVVKPFGRPRFMAAVERALRRLEAEHALGMKETLLALIAGVRRGGSDAPDAGSLVGRPPTGAAGRIGVRLGNRTNLVELDDIDWIEADGDLVKLHVGERTHLLKSSMADVEAELAGRSFLRIHRSTIVNLARVEVLLRERDGGGAVRLEGGIRLRVARGRWSELERALGLAGSA